MATYQDIYNARKGEGGGGAALRNRIEVGIVAVAMEHVQDVNADLKALARDIVQNSTSYTERIIWAVLAQPTIATKLNSASDGEIHDACLTAIGLFV